MARIRTIKPEFWTDEKIMESSPIARLLLIGLLNFADDKGNIEAGPLSIKTKIFPNDDIDVVPLLSELCENHLLNAYGVEDEDYYNIRGFIKHQKIDNPSKPRCPLYDPSETTQEPLPEDSTLEGKGREGRGKELKQNSDLYEEELKTLNNDDPIDQDSAFEVSWKYYPERIGKKAAKRSFKTTVKTKADWLRHVHAFNEYVYHVRSKRNEGQKLQWQNGSTWFNNWEDWARKAEAHP